MQMCVRPVYAKPGTPFESLIPPSSPEYKDEDEAPKAQ
jgi:hypothetical protein